MDARSVVPALIGGLVASPAVSQHPPGMQGSSNMKIVAHIPVGGSFFANDLEIEQELSRPYAYVSRRATPGFHIISLQNLDGAKVIFSWVIENPELHVGYTADNKYFKVRGRYYDVQSFQFGQSGPDADVGAVVHDVTGLPDTETIREVGRVRAPDAPGGFHNIYAYKHSDGRALLFTTNGNPGARIYDMDRFVGGDQPGSFIGRVPNPTAAAV